MIEKKGQGVDFDCSQGLAGGGRAGEIHIVVDTKGNIVLETMYTAGAACDRLAGEIEVALGEVVERTNKECYLDG